jgi:hypothetical protein
VTNETKLGLAVIELLELDETHLPRLISQISLAMVRLSERVASATDERTRNLLRKEYAVTLTAGVGDLTSHLNAANPPLMEHLSRAEVRHSSSPRASTPVGCRASLEQDWLTGFLYHAFEETELHMRAVDGTIGTLTGNATVVASSLLTDLASIKHRQLESMLVEELAALNQPVQKAA